MGLEVACDGGEGEGFFGLSVVEIGGEFWVSQADLVEEPGVEFGGVVGGGAEVGFGLEGESKGDEIGVGGNGEDGLAFGGHGATD